VGRANPLRTSGASARSSPLSVSRYAIPKLSACLQPPSRATLAMPSAASPGSRSEPVATAYLPSDHLYWSARGSAGAKQGRRHPRRQRASVGQLGRQEAWYRRPLTPESASEERTSGGRAKLHEHSCGYPSGLRARGGSTSCLTPWTRASATTWKPTSPGVVQSYVTAPRGPPRSAGPPHPYRQTCPRREISTECA